MHDLVKALRVLFEPWNCLHSYMVPKDDTRDQSDGRYRQQIAWHKKHFKNTMKENLRWPHFTGWPDPHRGSSTVCCNVTATQPQAAFSLQPSLPQPVQQLTWQYHSSIRHGSLTFRPEPRLLPACGMYVGMHSINLAYAQTLKSRQLTS